jgi:hypothetical protein
VTVALTIISAALVASLFGLSLGRLILCRLLFKLARVAVGAANAIMNFDRRC